jgi:hypothetical protein
MVLLNLTFFGSFFILRDRKDIIKLKFLERESRKNGLENLEINTSFLKNMDHNSVSFFQKPKLILYPLGIFISSISINMIIHGNNFLPKVIFNLEDNQIITGGFILLFLGGGFIGIDWLRIFQRLYPEVYKDIIYGLDIIIENYNKNN